MTVLQINKFYYPRGGAEVAMLGLSKLLECHGHAVVPFAMRHPENLPTPYAGNFVSAVQTESVRFNWQGLRTAGRMLYSFEARRRLRTLLRTTKPEVAHLHNIYHQLSPSVIAELARAGVPRVMSVHDFALLGPKHILFDHGGVCERGLARPADVISHRCIKDSTVASAFAAFVFSFHRRWYRDGIQHFIAPSQFMKERLLAGGFTEDRISVIPPFVDTKVVTPAPGVGDYVGYIGRLAPEKGVDVLVAAARELPEISIQIAGTGPAEDALRDLVARERLRNVTFVGRLDGVARLRFLRNAWALVVPSLTLENAPLVIPEAYAAGLPVVAAHHGGIPEMVREGETGLLVPVGDSRALAAAIRSLAEDQALRERMGRAGRALAETEYSPERHYELTMSVYQSVI